MRDNTFHTILFAALVVLCVGGASGLLPAPVVASPQLSKPYVPAYALQRANDVKEVRHLADFENNAMAAPGVLAAIAELEENQAVMERVQAENSVRVIGAGGTGVFKEQVTDDRSRQYQRIYLKSGFRYPLLGSRNDLLKKMLQAQVHTQISQLEKEQVIRESILSIRQHYINYWASVEKEKLIRLFLANEADMTRILQDRTDTGHLLDADRQEFLSAFMLARRDLAQSAALKQRAIGVLRLLTGRDIDHFAPSFPKLTTPCLDSSALQEKIINDHPQVLQLQCSLDDLQKRLALADRSNLKAGLSLASNFSYDIPGTEPGYGLALEFSVDFPVKFRQAASARRNSLRAALKKTRLQLESIRSHLLIEATEALHGIGVSEKNLDFSLRRVQAAQEKLRESLLRYAYLPGDVIEKVQQARFEYYKAAIGHIGAQAVHLQHIARLLSFGTDECGENVIPSLENLDGDYDVKEKMLRIAPPEADVGNRLGKKTGPDQAGRHIDSKNALLFTLYVWDSRRLIRRYSGTPNFFQSLKQRNIERLLVSFTTRQIEELDSPATRFRLESMIGDAEKNGIRLDLLLGEPTWILPEYRGKLLGLIKKLSVFSFKGIHLDLEPNQLSSRQYDDTYLLKQLSKTLQAAKSVSRIPLGLSIHYRFFDRGKYGFCLGTALENIGLDEIALMIYISDTTRAAEVASAILNRYPGLKFAVAQSVEPVLTANESHHTKTRKEFRFAMARLSTELRGRNFSGIFVQSWSDFERMAP